MAISKRKKARKYNFKRILKLKKKFFKKINNNNNKKMNNNN